MDILNLSDAHQFFSIFSDLPLLWIRRQSITHVSLFISFTKNKQQNHKKEVGKVRLGRIFMHKFKFKIFRVPEQLMRAMAAEAEAAREARAKVMNDDSNDHNDNNDQVIAAEGEHKASRALKHAAEVITDSPAALQVICRLAFDNVKH